MGRWPFWRSCIEVSNWTSGCGAIFRHNLRPLLLPRVLPHDNLYACEIEVHVGTATHAKRNCLAGLATNKSENTVTHLHTWRRHGPHHRFPLYMCWKLMCKPLIWLQFILSPQLMWQDVSLKSSHQKPSPIPFLRKRTKSSTAAPPPFSTTNTTSMFWVTIKETAILIKKFIARVLWLCT